MPEPRCILSKFYIKPQHSRFCFFTIHSCILSKFYIKPQHVSRRWHYFSVVSYRNSTSNHNLTRQQVVDEVVVSYRNSTSNHNFCASHASRYTVVSYRNSTSNHNGFVLITAVCMLYLIEILHQTTTRRLLLLMATLLYLIEILHQTTTELSKFQCLSSCILSKFYIKPQP